MVIGGGNVAMDSARTALRLGAEKVILAYRRGHDEMPARAEEIHHAEEEASSSTSSRPHRVPRRRARLARAAIMQKMDLGEPDDSGAVRAGVGSEYEEPIDVVVIASALVRIPSSRNDTRLAINKWGYITSTRRPAPRIFPRLRRRRHRHRLGDGHRSHGRGRKAASAINAYLEGLESSADTPASVPHNATPYRQRRWRVGGTNCLTCLVPLSLKAESVVR